MDFAAFVKSRVSFIDQETNQRVLNIFHRGDYFTLHGDDAIFVADTFFKTRQVLKPTSSGSSSQSQQQSQSSDNTTLWSVSVSGKRLTAILREVLIGRRWTVNVWRKQPQQQEWEVAVSGSLANLTAFESIVSIDELMKSDNLAGGAGSFGSDDIYRDTVDDFDADRGQGQLGSDSVGMSMTNSGSNTTATAVMAVRFQEVDGSGVRRVGVASIDLNQSSITVSEFIDDETLSSFASFLVRCPAFKCYCTADVPQPQSLLSAGTSASTTSGFFTETMNAIRERLTDSDVQIIEMNRSATASALTGNSSQHSLDSVIAPLVSPPTKAQFANFFESIEDSSLARDALAILVGQLHSTLSGSPSGSFTAHVADIARFMRLDQAALVALNVFPGPQDTNKQMSLAGLLGITRTAAGTRRLHQWLRLPLLDLDEINQRHDAVEAFVSSDKLLSSIISGLRALPDVERLCRRIVRAESDAKASGRATSSALNDVVGLYQFASRLPSIIMPLRQVYEGNQDESKVDSALESSLGDDFIPHADKLWSNFGEPLLANSDMLRRFEEMVTKTIDLTPTAAHEYMILPSFNEDLMELDRRRRSLEREAEKVRVQVAMDLNLEDKKVKLNYVGHLGYHLRVSRKDEKNLRGSKNYTTLDTRKGGVMFTNTKMRNIAAEYKEIMDDYQTTQSVIVAMAIEVAASFVTQFEVSASILADLDVLCAFATASKSSSTPYVRPKLFPLESTMKLNEESEMIASSPNVRRAGFYLIGARHPCLEVQAGVSFVPNDIELVKGKSNVQIITGPNMGGKSTYIRTAGVVAVMAQIGCFVPCEEAEMNIVSCVLARVGAGDSQIRGVSTFMKEMLEASAILRSSNSDSLIIIDELGRGTSTYDGFGLAWAIAEHIATKIGAYALFATHFHELTSLSGTLPNVVNKHVTAHTGHGTITMLYRLRDGACDRSFGIHVAELANFPTSVVERAREKAKELESFGKESAVLVEELKTSGTFEMKSSENDMQEDKQTQFLKSFVNMDLNSVDPETILNDLQKVLAP